MSLQDDTSPKTTPNESLPVPTRTGKDGRRYFSEKQQRAIAERAQKLMKTQSLREAAHAVNVNESLLQRWFTKYKMTPLARAGVRWDGHRKEYSDDFKATVVKRVASGEMPKTVAADLDIHPSNIWKWVKDARVKRPQGAPVKSAAAPQPGPMKLPDNVKDAISFLRHAKSEIHAMLARKDIKEMDQAHLLAQLALNALLKGT